MKSRNIVTAAIAMMAIAAYVTLTPVAPVKAAGGIQTIGNCTTIDKPGSYVLGNNIQAGQKDVGCILITTNHVTLDLSGYTILGPGAGGDGITTGGQPLRGITVRNGTVRGFGADGIRLDGSEHTIEDMRVLDNGDDGIRVRFANMIRRNIVAHNVAIGIDAGEGSSIDGNIAYENRVGIRALCPGVILHNSAYQNQLDIAALSVGGGGPCTQLENSPLP